MTSGNELCSDLMDDFFIITGHRVFILNLYNQNKEKVTLEIILVKTHPHLCVNHFWF